MARDEEFKPTIEAIVKQRIKTFSRMEKAFYSSIVLTALVMATGIIYMQSNLLQVQSQMTKLQAEIDVEELDLENAKQEINELTRYNRLMDIAEEAGLTFQTDNKGLPE